MNSGQLFIISAPSGAGKTTILKRVMAELAGLAFSISHTTRPQRAGEVPGRDYHFLNREEFGRLRDSGDFLEWAEVHGNLYGTSRRAVAEQLASGLDVILDIDIQGAGQVQARTEWPTITIFIMPPSLAELERRLAGRGTDQPEIIKQRLANAVRELAAREMYDHLVVNDKLDQAVEMVKAVILAARSRSRRNRDGGPLPDIPAGPA